jgi:hypothetical protein
MESFPFQHKSIYIAPWEFTYLPHASPLTESFSAADLVGDGVLAAEGVTYVLSVWSEL